MGELAAKTKALMLRGQRFGVKDSEVGLREQDFVVERIERAQRDAKLVLEKLETEDMNAGLGGEDEWEDIDDADDEADGMVEDDEHTDDGSDLPALLID